MPMPRKVLFCFLSNVNILIEEHKDLQLTLGKQADPSEGRRGVWHKWGH